jgi:hypothetical protein
MYVFGPAATGIRRALNIQEADRLASALEREMTSVRDKESSDYQNGFEKGYDWIENSYNPREAIFVYQYRGDPSDQRSDGTLNAMPRAQGTPGKDYVVQPMARRLTIVCGRHQSDRRRPFHGEVHPTHLHRLPG